MDYEAYDLYWGQTGTFNTPVVCFLVSQGKMQTMKMDN